MKKRSIAIATLASFVAAGVCAQFPIENMIADKVIPVSYTHLTLPTILLV